MMKIKITYHISKIFCDSVLYGIISYGAAKLSWGGSQKKGEHVHIFSSINVMILSVLLKYFMMKISKREFFFYDEDLPIIFFWS